MAAFLLSEDDDSMRGFLINALDIAGLFFGEAALGYEAFGDLHLR